jgi:hypothetical protein
VRGAPVETLTIAAKKDRTFQAFPDRQVDVSGGARYERDQGRLVALPHDPKDPVAPLDGQVLDVGITRLADPQPDQPQQ